MTGRPVPARPAWLRSRSSLLKLAVCTIGLAILYFPVLASLCRDWMILPDFSHGFLVPLISLYFVWQVRGDLDLLPISPRKTGLLVLAAGLLLLLLGVLASESFSMRFSLLVVLSGMVIYLLGWPQLRKLLFPIAFLAFMIPVPSIFLTKLTFPLQLFVSSVASFGFRILGLTVTREGNVIHLASVSLQVVEACSGIRSLISLLALGTTFAFLMTRSPWRRTVLIVACLPIAVLLNVLRVMITGLLSNRAGAKVAEGFFHDLFGILLFLLAFLLLVAIWRVLERIGPGADSQRSPHQSGAASRVMEPVAEDDGSPGEARPFVSTGKILVVLSLLLLTVAARSWLSRGEVELERESLGSFPEVIGDWTLTDESNIGEGAMEVLRVDDYIMRRYENREGRAAWLYIGYYSSQREGKQIHSPRQCLPGYGWNRIESEVLPLPRNGGELERDLINSDLMVNGTDRYLYFWWYQGRGRIYSSEYRNKFYLLRDSILMNRTDGALIRVSLAVATTPEDTKETLLDFASGFVPLLDQYIPDQRGTHLD